MTENHAEAAVIGPMSEGMLEAAAPLPRGRTAPLNAEQERELLHRGVALCNGARYWHAHEAWEILWRAAPDEERDFYQGLIQIASDPSQKGSSTTSANSC